MKIRGPRAGREIAIGVTALLLGLAGGLALANVPIPDTGWLRPVGLGFTAEPVLVVVVGSRENVQRVHEAVAARRIVAITPDGFALRERRIVVASAEAAGPLLVTAGWRDAPLDIVGPPWSERRDEPSDAQAARMAELVKKPTLTLAEARAVLDSL